MPFGVIFAWDARRHAPAPSLINANRPSCRVCRLQRRRSVLEAPCPLVCLVCRPGGRPTFSCDPEAHAVRERPSSAAAHAPGGASLYNGAMARLLDLSSAENCLCWGGLRPPCERAAQPAQCCTYPKRGETVLRVQSRSDMERNARIYANGQLPGPLSVQPRAADLRRGRHERRPASPPVPCFRCRFCWLLSASAPTILPGRR